MRLWFDDLALVVDTQRDGRSYRVTIDEGDVSSVALGEAIDAGPREPFAGLADASMITTASADPELLDATRLADGRVAALLVRKDRLVLAHGDRLPGAGERWPVEAPLVVKGAKNATWPQGQGWSEPPSHGRGRKLSAERGSIRLRARGEAVAIACARTGLCARVDRPGEAPHLLRAPIADGVAVDALPTADGLLVTLIAATGETTLVHWDLGGKVLGARSAFAGVAPVILGDVALFFDHGRAPAQDQLLRLRLPALGSVGEPLIVDTRATALAVSGDGRRFALALGRRVLVGDVSDGSLDVDGIHAVDVGAFVEEAAASEAAEAAPAADEAAVSATDEVVASDDEVEAPAEAEIIATTDEVVVDELEVEVPADREVATSDDAVAADDEVEAPVRDELVATDGAIAPDVEAPAGAPVETPPEPERDAPIPRAHLRSSEVIRMATPAAAVAELVSEEDPGGSLSPEEALDQLGLDEAGDDVGAPVEAIAAAEVIAVERVAVAEVAVAEIATTDEVAAAEIATTDEVAAAVIAKTDEVAAAEIATTDEVAAAGIAKTDEVAAAGIATTDEVAAAEIAKTDEVAAPPPGDEVTAPPSVDEVDTPPCADEVAAEAIAPEEPAPDAVVAEPLLTEEKTEAVVADPSLTEPEPVGATPSLPEPEPEPEAAEPEPPRPLALEDGAPRLTLPMGQPPAAGWSATVGASFEIVVVLRSAGRASAGVRVSVGGEAVARGLVDLQAIDDAGALIPLTPGGAGMRIADADALTIPAGLRVPVEPPPVRDVDRRAVADALAASHVRVVLRGRGVRPGSGLLTVAIAPREAVDAPLRLIRPVSVTR